MNKPQADFFEEIEISNAIMIYKFALGVLELFLGFGIIFLGDYIFNLYQKLKSNQLLEDPHDLLGDVLEKIIPFVAEHRGYLAVILIILGIVKIVAVIGLRNRKRWGLDILVALTITLLPFDFFYLIHNFSDTNIIFFLINIFIAFYLVNFKPKQYFKSLKNK